MKLNWSLSEGPQPVLQYELRRNGADSFLVDNPVYNNTGLQPGTAYSYQVRAIDVIGNTSEFSAALTVRTQSEGGGDAKPTTPVLSLADVTQSSVSLTWTPSTSDSQIVRYQIGRNGWPFQTIASVTTAYTDSDVTADTQYEYYVVAQDTELQWSEVSNVLKVKTAGETPAPGNPSLPLDFKSTEQTTTSVTLDWSKAKVAHVQYDLFRDNVFYSALEAHPLLTQVSCTAVFMVIRSRQLTAWETALSALKRSWSLQSPSPLTIALRHQATYARPLQQ
ncbi:fibronectin type III domain-containing protein [Pseudomonas amygdali pv. morsprunorum]|nr:fibronectin type III domain-containing protein [Pseudomonas amygdali pv. morsprunorum]